MSMRKDSLIVFLGTVDLPRIHPVEVLDEVVRFLNGQGLSESWRLTGLTTSAFKKETFPDVFMIGAYFGNVPLRMLIAVLVFGRLRDACVEVGQCGASDTAAGGGVGIC